jgi:hypothetical protein
LLSKNITVSSNDPNNASTILRINAFVEIEFAFEAYSLPMGKITKDETVAKVAKLMVKDMEKTEVIDVQTSSKFVKFRQMDPIVGDDGYARIPFEIKILPGLAPGRFRETLTVYSNLEAFPKATLTINGIIEGDIVIEPESIRFLVYDSLKARNQTVQKLAIKYNSNARPLEITAISEKENRLEFELDTITQGSEYEIIAKLKDDFLQLQGNRSGYIILDTNDPIQQKVKVLYQITYRHQ